MGNSNSTRWNGHRRRRTVGELDPLAIIAFTDALNDALRRWDAAGRPAVAGWLRDSAGAPRVSDVGWRFGPPIGGGTWRTVAWVPLRRDPAIGKRVPGGPPLATFTAEPTPARFGGVRWFWRCAGCLARCATLYVPRRGREPLLKAARCRRCLRLAYPSQQITPEARLHLRARTLARRLGHPGTIVFDPAVDRPSRPKGMHRRRYARELARFDAACDAWEAKWMDRWQRSASALLGRFQRRACAIAVGGIEWRRPR